MKKFFSVMLALILILSCSACGKKIEERIGYTSEAKEEVYKNEYKDSNGNVSSKLEYHYPVISGLSDDVSNTINKAFQDRIKQKDEELKKNADNVTEYLENFDIEGPQITIVEFEEYYVDEYVASFIIKERTATNPEDVAPTYKGISFSLSNGAQLSVSNLTLPGKEAETDTIIRERIVTEANTSYSPNGSALDEEKEELLKALYDEKNFVTDGYTLVFVYNYSTLSRGSKTGLYLCEVDVSDMGGYITCPVDYGQN